MEMESYKRIDWNKEEEWDKVWEELEKELYRLGLIKD